MALKDIKAKIQATKRMHTVTRAMEAVSAVKMRKTQAAAFDGRAYARAALSILARLSGSSDVQRHPLTQSRPVKRIALVVITSDKGLAGGLNSGVIKAALRAIEGRSIDSSSCRVCVWSQRRGILCSSRIQRRASYREQTRRRSAFSNAKKSGQNFQEDFLQADMMKSSRSTATFVQPSSKFQQHADFCRFQSRVWPSSYVTFSPQKESGATKRSLNRRNAYEIRTIWR